jgi:hypothetical protein
MVTFMIKVCFVPVFKEAEKIPVRGIPVVPLSFNRMAKMRKSVSFHGVTVVLVPNILVRKTRRKNIDKTAKRW